MATRAERRRAERERLNEEKRKKKQDAEKQRIAAAAFKTDLEHTGLPDADRALADPFYMQQLVAKRIEQKKQMERNGITRDDLQREYDEGYKRGQADTRKELTTFFYQMFYSGIAIAAHRHLGFGKVRKTGKSRIYEFLCAVQNIMLFEEIDTVDLMQKCYEETGIDIVGDDFNY